MIQVRNGLSEELPHEFDSFYDDIISWMWETGKWETLLDFAEAFYTWKGFDERERDYKLEVADNLGEARRAFRENSDDWHAKLETAFGPPNNLANWRLRQDLFEWLEANPEQAQEALEGLWAESGSASDRLGAFLELAPDDVGSGPGTRLSLASFLLMGVDAESYPYYQQTPFRDVYSLVEHPEPNYSAPVETYRHALDFLDTVVEGLAARNVDCRDRLDAQSLVWMLTRTHPAELDFLADTEQKQFAEFVDKPVERSRDVWIFQGNPERHEDLKGQLEEHIGSDDLTWSVTDYHDDIGPGDLVLFWRSGDEAGVIAAGEITGQPRPRAEDEKYTGADDEHGVSYRPDVVLEEPIPKQTLVDDPVLRDMQIVRAPMGTNFPVDPDDWRRLLSYRPELVAELPVAALREHFNNDDYKSVSLNYLARIDRKHANILKRLDTLLDGFGLFIRLWFQHHPEIQDEERQKHLGRKAHSRWKGFVDKLQDMVGGDLSLRKAFESDVARPEDSAFNAD